MRLSAATRTACRAGARRGSSFIGRTAAGLDDGIARQTTDNPQRRMLPCPAGILRFSPTNDGASRPMSSDTTTRAPAPPAPSPASGGADAAKAAPRLKLPHPRHASRIPADVSEAGVIRIQGAAYLLPQVVKPADYLDEGAPHFEQRLDTLGLILLQRAAPGARPSRWIQPAHLQAALAPPRRRGLRPAGTWMLGAARKPSAIRSAASS